MKIIKRLTISILFISIIGIILYTCSSPVAVQGLTVNNDTFNSEAIISSSSGDKTFLGVTVSSTSITLSFKSVTNATTNELGKEVISAPDGTNTISGVYPIVNFQDGAFSGTITFIDESQLKITFQQNNYPYFKMRDVTCKK
ncbi:unknown [Brachyspira sp. CAG:700]|nr:unknown [Brachyspira sp. CAG:700]